MARYSVQHDYRSERDGELIGPWLKGEEIDLDENVAAFVEVDSPGALKPAKAAASTKGQAAK